MTGILLDVAYFLGLLISSPVWVYRMIRHGRYRSDWSERLGAAPVRYGRQPVIWIHGVSLGEVNAARSLVDEIHSQLPDFRVAISSTTQTGIDAARKRFEPDLWVFRWPMDFTFAVRRALSRLRPSLVVLMEGELWPNFLAACNRRDIPVVVANARMGADKGYPRYRMLGALGRKLMFTRVSAVGVQHESYAERFIELGTLPERVHLTGMLKYDSAVVADRIDGQENLAAAMGIRSEDQLIVVGGTGPGEERLLLEMFTKLRESHPASRLAIVPRKPERFDEVARLIESKGFAVVCRSQRPDGCDAPAEPDAVLLGDSMGELRKFYALADVVFVGRSLVEMGGSDMIEAAALGKPAAFGPHTFNFPQADDLAKHGCRRVGDVSELRRTLEAWLDDPGLAARDGAAAQQYVRSQQGATRRNVEMICQVLGREPAVAPGVVATDRIAAG